MKKNVRNEPKAWHFFSAKLMLVVTRYTSRKDIIIFNIKSSTFEGNWTDKQLLDLNIGINLAHRGQTHTISLELNSYDYF